METAAESAVLVIDDEVNVVNAIRRTLRGEPYSVECTTDPVQALEIAKTLQPTVVICDMRMPVLTGVEVLAALSRSNPQCVKILLTGYADMNSTIAAINEGHVDKYMTKPWNDEELKLTLRQQIHLSSLKNERDLLAQKLTLKVRELNALNTELDQRVQARTQELEQTNLFLEQAYADLNTQFLNAVKVFSNLIDMSAPDMAGHHRRVAEMARLFAQEMNLSDAEVRDIYIAGLLHDIGKTGLPEKLLTSPISVLDATSRQMLQRHPLKGQTALLALPELNSAALYIRQHHERIDGQGFPDGLAGREISRGAKILAVAEDWDELQLGWLATRKLNMAESVEFIQQGSGKRYDPAVVDLLPAVLTKLEAAPREDEEIRDSRELVPGMLVTRDLHNQEGLLLTAKGTQVSTTLIQHLRTSHSTDETALKVYCKKKLAGLR
ncbi:MAG TPA: HD domain-containing phosphohydrolase [Limnobacter sp.]|nr:HD domain-containing phosphohydrolase [Limnobacter sp.]